VTHGAETGNQSPGPRGKGNKSIPPQSEDQLISRGINEVHSTGMREAGARNPIDCQELVPLSESCPASLAPSSNLKC
jgi:hypothetical protein